MLFVGYVTEYKTSIRFSCADAPFVVYQTVTVCYYNLQLIILIFLGTKQIITTPV